MERNSLNESPCTPVMLNFLDIYLYMQQNNAIQLYSNTKNSFTHNISTQDRQGKGKRRRDGDGVTDREWARKASSMNVMQESTLCAHSLLSPHLPLKPSNL
jgi:hypothetical protein